MNVYSPSRLSSYESCPRHFHYRYVQRIPAASESIEAFLGKRVHEILERLYHHVARWRRPPSLRQVLDRYRGDWQLRWHDAIEIVRSERDAAHYLEAGTRCLTNYYRSYYPFDDGETLAIEAPVDFALDAGGRYRMRGVIDRLVRRGPGHYEIHDYKTGGYLPPQSRLDEDRQLATYQLGLEQRYPDAERVDLVWHYLAFNRTLRSARSAEQLGRLRTRTIGLIDAIESATEFPARPGTLCRWCEYRALCPEGSPAQETREPSTGPPAELPVGLAPPAPPRPFAAVAAGTQLSLL